MILHFGHLCQDVVKIKLRRNILRKSSKEEKKKSNLSRTKVTDYSWVHSAAFKRNLQAVTVRDFILNQIPLLVKLPDNEHGTSYIRRPVPFPWLTTFLLKRKRYISRAGTPPARKSSDKKNPLDFSEFLGPPYT